MDAPIATSASAFAEYLAIRDRLPAPARQVSRATRVGGLAEAAEGFDVVLLDAYGVLNVGETPVPRAAERVAALRRAGKRVMVVSNSAGYPKRVMMAIAQKLRKKQVVITPNPEPRRSYFKGQHDRRRSTLHTRRSDLASALANAAPHERAAILYPNDPEAQRLHNEMLFGSESASSETSQNPSPRI